MNVDNREDLVSFEEGFDVRAKADMLSKGVEEKGIKGSHSKEGF